MIRSLYDPHTGERYLSQKDLAAWLTANARNADEIARRPGNGMKNHQRDAARSQADTMRQLRLALEHPEILPVV